MKLSRITVAVAVVAACSAGVYTIASASDHPPRTDAGMVTASASSELPREVLQILQEQRIAAVPVPSSDAADLAIKVDPAAQLAAIAAARAEFGLDANSAALSASLVSLTTKTPAAASSDESGLPAPQHKSRMVWLVALADVPNPYRGPMQANVPKAEAGVLVAPVDARTGQVLFAFVS